MKTFHWLRLFIAAFWVAGVLGLTLDIMLASRLPEALQRWNQAQIQAGLTVVDALVLGIGGIAILVNIAGSIALFNRRRWGARTFLLSSVVGAVVMLGVKPSVTHPIAEAVSEAQMVLEGLIIGLAYFSHALQPDDGLPENVEETFT